MRFLHTSDWHLGRSFHGTGMLDAQRSFLDQLINTVTERQVDVVLVSGDVYDRALPGVDVVRLLNDALVRLRAAGAAVVITSGNHDSAVRLGFGSGIMELGGVHLRTRIEDIDRPVMFADGPVRIAIYGIPYLEPRLSAPALAAAPDHESVTRAAVMKIRTDIDARTRSAEGDVLYPVVLAHTFASGGLTSDSERDLSVGGVGAVPLDLFDGFTYSALGHLHGQQQLSHTVRYCGSPLAYSFSEARQTKGAYLVDIDSTGLTSVEPVEWDAPRNLAVLRGTLAELLSDAELAWAEDAYCHVTLVDNQRPAKAMETVRRRFPNTLVLVFAPAAGSEAEQRTYSQRLAAATSDLDVCCGFLEHVRARAPGEEERAALQSAMEAVRVAEVPS